MKEFFEAIKIREYFFVHILIGFTIVILSEQPFLKKYTVLGDYFWGMAELLLLLLWYWYKLFKNKVDLKRVFSDFKIKPKWREILKVSMACFALTMAFSLVIFCLSYKFEWEILKKLTEPKTSTSSPLSFLFLSIAAILIAPIVEELTFRGVLLHRLKAKWGLTVTVIVVSIGFGLLHIKSFIITHIIFAIMMSLLYIEAQNILVPICAHCFYNLMTCLSAPLISLFFLDLNGELNLTESKATSYIIIGMIILIISASFIIKYIYNNWPKTKVSNCSILSSMK